ncbi:hypothetical protein GCM10028787_26640 [Brachybacterium horti]
MLPRTRTIVAATRVEVPPGGTEASFPLSLDELGSWASGSPRAVPVVVELWAQPVLDPPQDAVRLRVKDREKCPLGPPSAKRRVRHSRQRSQANCSTPKA